MYGIRMHVPAPSELYRPVHQAVMEIVEEEGGGEGLVAHVAYRTEQGFDIVEVWESREQCEAFNASVMPKALERAGVAEDAPEPQIEEFEPLGVMAPAAGAAGAAGR